MQAAIQLPEQTKSIEAANFTSVIKEAMVKTGALKETELCRYIPHGNEHLSQDLFMRFKEVDKQRLFGLMNLFH